MLRWLLVPAIALHGFEEWLTIGTYGSIDGGLLYGLGKTRPSPSLMEAALAIAAIAPALVVLLSIVGTRSPFKDWLVCLIGCVFLANAFFPHILATIASGSYTPGVASAVLLNLPLAIVLLRAARMEERLERIQLVAAMFGGILVLPLSLAIIWPIAKAIT